jgi:peptidoglycan hydrolase CwlO-like protein
MWQNFHKVVLSLLVVFIGVSLLVWPERWSKLWAKEDSNKIIELQDKNKKFEEENRKLDDRISFFQNRHIADSLRIDSLRMELEIIDKDMDIVDGRIKLTKKELDKLKKDRLEHQKTIDKIKNSPNTKVGEELIHSIDQKLKNIK